MSEDHRQFDEGLCVSQSVPSSRKRLAASLRNTAMRIVGPDRVARIWWRFRGRESDHFTGDRKRRFEYMYETGYWVRGEDGPLSGWGSSLEATGSIRQELPKLLQTLQAQSLLDLGCGDFTWMKTVELPCPYIGVDIVPQVIGENEAKFADDQRSFIVLDACEEELPPADVVLCREVLFHLSFEDMEKMFANVKRCGARYFIATTNVDVRINLDIPSGEHSDRNLELEPLRLPKPEHALWDGALAEGRVLGVWKIR